MLYYPSVRKSALLVLSLIMCFALLQTPRAFGADSVDLSLTLNPDVIVLNGKVDVEVKLTLNGEALFGEIVFFGVKGIKGSFSSESVLVGSTGIAKTTFTPVSIGNGAIIAKINVRIGSDIITVEKQAKLKVGDWNLPPKAFIDKVNPEKPRAGKPARFFGYGQDNDGSVESWVWDIGDGVLYKGEGNFAEITHTYQNVGTYNSTFQVVDNVGESSEKVTRVIEVVENAPPQISQFGEWITRAVVEQEIVFQVDVFDSEGALSQCVFDWGDGNNTTIDLTGQSQRVPTSHTYKSDGKYIINATVFDEVGDFSSCFEQGWEITVLSNAKGGIEIDVSGNSGRIFNLYGPLPSRKLARQVSCSEKGIYLGQELLPGLYKVVDAKREFELRPDGVDKFFLVRPFEVASYKAMVWRPSVSYKVQIFDDEPILKVYLNDERGLIDEPALALFEADSIELIRNKSSNSGIFELPFNILPQSNDARVELQVFVSGVFIRDQIRIPLPLPTLDLGIESINDNFNLKIDTESAGETVAVGLSTTVFDSRTGMPCDVADVIDYLPQVTTLSRVPFEFVSFDNRSRCVTIKGRFEVGKIEVVKTISFKSDIQNAMFELDWGFDAINRVAILGNIGVEPAYLLNGTARLNYKIYAPKEEFDELVFTGLPKECDVSDNSFFLIIDLDNVQRLVKSDGVEVFVSFDLMGITFTKSFIVRKYDRWHSFVHAWNGDVLRFHITKIDGTRSSGAWVNLDYYKDGVRVSQSDLLNPNGLPDAIRLSYNGYGHIDFGGVDTNGFSIVARTLVDDLPLLKVMRRD